MTTPLDVLRTLVKMFQGVFDTLAKTFKLKLA
jgi:hypothetical protein